MKIAYQDSWVERLTDDIACLINGDATLVPSVEARLLELAMANAPEVADYWRATEAGRGVPDSAFKRTSMYLFPEIAPVRIFFTSGTSGALPGRAAYSPRGLHLMENSICTQAKRHIVGGLERPAMIRIVPSADAAPAVIMAYGMEIIVHRYGHPDLSCVVVGPEGIDLDRLGEALDDCVYDGVPVILIGGTFAFVAVCDAFKASQRRWSLPSGSRLVDAGGGKGRSRSVGADELRQMAEVSFGISPTQCVNIFGMTELASQLYDACDRAVGPTGERPKAGTPFVTPRVLDPHKMTPKEGGLGLLELRDLCIIDRPYCVLTGDVALATAEGVAIIERVERGHTRGCSLAFQDAGSG